MIYAFPSTDDPIRQGDIFWPVPRLEFSLDENLMPFVIQPGDEGVRQLEWQDFVNSPVETQALVTIHAVIGIVITQDCDASRCENITLSEIRPFPEVERSARDATKPKSIVDLVIKQARVNQKWYYLPVDPRVGFEERMAADFLQVFQVPTHMLLAHRGELRRARLNDCVAWPHFREKVAEFFRRYPYNEWYPLDSEELAVYTQSHGQVDRYAWQTKRTS